VAAGEFALNDPRFHAAAGATAGHDGDDRVVYDTSTGSVYFDQDGSGGAAAEMMFVLQGAPALAATDIAIDGFA
jgi:hypothetical protein